LKARVRISLVAAGVRREHRWVLEDVTLELEPGQRWALIGENGAGKTHLLKLLAAELWPTPTGHERRDYRLGRGTLELHEAKPRLAYLGAEFQDKYVRYGWDPCIEDLIATGLHHTQILRSPVTPPQRRRVREWLARCGLTRHARRPLSTLSYGQRRLALLARALAAGPDWLFLDELYNGLDATARQRIDRLLATARRQGVSWMIAAHRGADIPQGTSHLLELRAGRLGPPRSLSRARLETLRRTAREPKHVPAVPVPGVAAAPGGSGALRARPLRGRAASWWVRLAHADVFVEGQRVLCGLDWTVHRGEHWAIVGANGAGKSTLLKVLYGDLAPALGGRLERAGHPPGTPIAQWKRRVGLVSPELQTDYLIDVSLIELVASGAHASIGLIEPPGPRERARSRRWLERLGLADCAERRPREVSYGQLRRALIARALHGGARLLLLDEPLTGLDPAQRASMKHLLERLMQVHVTLVMAVHHTEDLPRGITRVLRLAGRRGQPGTL
jgi:molybdate transport system ATP-binding protein